ncbi:hypothetical protein A5886_000382 [Enterococcus sp. 8G7_MSG3316]|uniref:Uncharacterized protein n=1 Tax=Candidatus Enterococcus testudinis TaxID=1834191 RepID=A0A242A2Y4_9ENTE|nr:cellobiose phosphorylase [Enterococcus sp. 8G7_MSG3316]OTN75312.1 hypothetical protein A5886_000382 [Enterococcus sp. 8G7_MSG3316]
MTKKIQVANADTTAVFLPTGDLYEIQNHDLMINQLNGNPLDGSLNQLYLRIEEAGEISFTPLIGSNARSTFAYNEHQVQWSGQYRSVAYQVDFQLAENVWFWRVQLSGSGKADVVYGQDLGNAAKGAVQSNEAYVSQYIDHHVTESQGRITVSSRQNQPQNGQFPLVEQGSFQSLKGYATDGYQFFGRSYKTSNSPEALQHERLPNEVYQYECAYIALQSQWLELSDTPTDIVFYAAVKENQAEAVTGPQFSVAALQTQYDQLVFEDLGGQNMPAKKLGPVVVGETWTEAEIVARFPQRQAIETVDGQTYSFFTDAYHHVVLKDKEAHMERSHGHILLSGQSLTVDQPIMSTTVYMSGIFNSQIVLGNTSMNKLLSNSRNALNLIKQSGQRIYLKEADQWRLLTMPSAFEMGLNSATWYYKLADDVIKVTTYTQLEGRQITTTIHSEQQQSYTWAISNQFVMGVDDSAPTVALEVADQCVTIKGSAASPIHDAYPELTYYLAAEQPFTVENETLFNVTPISEEAALTVLRFDDQQEVSFVIQGTLDNTPYHTQVSEYAAEDQAYTDFIHSLLHQFELHHDSADVASFNILARWYTHNMLVHYLSPHGLEQYGGAAWGTRDVSQGPTEYFLAFNRPEMVASIIEHLFENQFEDDGNWPQWFMFDRYEKQKADESHGDVIVWPMKVVSDYLEKTKDYTILEKQIAYTDRDSFEKTASAPLFDHLKKEVAYIEANFLPGTYLSCYGDGDWDDTLQPNNSKLKKHMASSWTVALTYEVLKKLGKQLAAYDAEYAAHLTTLAAGVQKDFETYMLADGTLPGFVYMEDEDHVELMVHPTDKKTGIQYRLLPMQQSMIGELLSPEEADHHLAIIKEHLQFPDGVRLMNRPAQYQGGVSTNFKRAEQAANFGREIGLQYVHAHIRFTEAMAKLGNKQETWHALGVINPIQIKERVQNAELRQANAYFSSSDGDFKTRYQAQENFGKLKEGTVGVKGGWRIYSSGPGIYLNQLISQVLGIRVYVDHLELDPVLPSELDGLSLTYQIYDYPVHLIFHEAPEAKVVINGQAQPLDFTDNRYRQGAISFEKESFCQLLNNSDNTIDIYR